MYIQQSYCVTPTASGYVSHPSSWLGGLWCMWPGSSKVGALSATHKIWIPNSTTNLVIQILNSITPEGGRAYLFFYCNNDTFPIIVTCAVYHLSLHTCNTVFFLKIWRKIIYLKFSCWNTCNWRLNCKMAAGKPRCWILGTVVSRYPSTLHISHLYSTLSWSKLHFNMPSSLLVKTVVRG